MALRPCRQDAAERKRIYTVDRKQLIKTLVAQIHLYNTQETAEKDKWPYWNYKQEAAEKKYYTNTRGMTQLTKAADGTDSISLMQRNQTNTTGMKQLIKNFGYSNTTDEWHVKETDHKQNAAEKKIHTSWYTSGSKRLVMTIDRTDSKA